MWKKVAQALGAVPEESETEILETEGVDRAYLEIVSVKGTTETICKGLAGWISITSHVNGRNENSQTKRLCPHENCYFDNNNWWIYTEQLTIPRDAQLSVEFKIQFEAGDFTVGSASISWSALTEEVCEFDLTPHETSLAVKTKISNLRVAMRIDSKIALPSSGPHPAPPPVRAAGVASEDFPKVGTGRVTTWQGKNLASSYPVYLETTTNLMASRRFRSPPVINPHNPIFDHVSIFDLTSLQGDIFLIVREKHAVRSNRVVGQVVIPFSWIVDRLSLKLKSPNRSKATLSGWFELFPYCKPSRLNRGGQYRPFVAGIPQYAGYGVIKPEKSLGFLRIEIEFTLSRPLLYTMLAYPFCHSPHLSNAEYEDENPMAGMYVAKNNFKRIMKVWRLPLLVKTVSEIIHWRTHWSISAFVLYLHAYTFLLAPVWQFPLLVMFLALFIGVLAARRRTYDDAQLFVSEEDLAGPQESADEPKDSKSIAEKYKSLKNGVKSMEMSIDGMASLMEHINNLLLMSDPILSAVAFAFAFFVASLASFFLCFISPNTLVFLMGLALFSPDEAVLRSKVLSKNYARQVTRVLKKLIRSAKRAQILGFEGPMVLPGDYLHRLPVAATLSVMKQHELSGFLYSKTWPHSQTPSSDESHPSSAASAAAENVSSWSSRWCEIWHVPGLLKVTTTKNPEGMSSSLESFVPFSLEYTEATYIGKSLIERRRKNSTLAEPVDHLPSIGSLPDAEESRQRSASLSQRRTKTLFMFEVVHKDMKNFPARVYSGEDGLEYSCAGWVFGCSSQKEATEWVKAINSTSKLISIAAKEEDDLDSPLPEIHITTKVDEATGKLVSTDMTQKIGVDEITSGRDQKMSVIVKRFLLKWIGMIPDDLELAHRYFCRQQYLVDPGSTVDPNLKQNEWIDQLIPTMNKFVPSTSNLIEGEQRTIVDTSKRSRIDSIQSVGPSLVAAETDIIGTLLVKVMSARGLPVKELSISALPVSAGPFTLILPKIMVQISIVPSSISSLVYKSGAQPRGPAPVFREDFLFRDLNITRAHHDAAKVIVFVLLRTPLSIGNETTTVIASAEVSLKAFLSEAVPELTLPPEGIIKSKASSLKRPSNPHYEKQDWFLLFDPQRNLALPNNAGIQLKIKYLGGGSG